ncbi:hypothetical protein L1987_34100 [Smallanthus sonchifolius]|uniref:Uncharacterized protein n=1 Tax=Smallanthus sonchifolius TaxID=185202 RepID=A0ACB9HUD6_9ASTR|nr:hypothetical protein L1987_34100 [Smallanthus sonchifolius]
MEYQKPHAVCIPFPTQGHINPMLKLAKILHSKGFHITFVNTEFNHQRLLKSQGSNSLNRHQSFRFETIPDGLPPPENLDVTQDIPSLCKSTSENCLEPFKALLYKLNDTKTTPPVSCIVSDGIMSFTLDAADELGIPEALFWTNSACAVLAFAHYETFRQKGIIPLKEETKCLEWLDSKEPNSVVYVNFGSVTVMTPEQLVEFSWGLANSNQAFLWVIRPDLVYGDSRILQPEFLEGTKNTGLLAGWCPQEKVLNHPSVGGFLTHSGWNSTLESIASGVPMICWPFFADQQTNCWCSCNKWGIGMEIDSAVERKQVENLVKTLMRGERGKEMREMAIVWKQKAHSMSSWLNIDNFINQVLLRS